MGFFIGFTAGQPESEFQRHWDRFEQVCPQGKPLVHPRTRMAVFNPELETRHFFGPRGGNQSRYILQIMHNSTSATLCGMIDSAHLDRFQIVRLVEDMRRVAKRRGISEVHLNFPNETFVREALHDCGLEPYSLSTDKGDGDFTGSGFSLSDHGRVVYATLSVLKRNAPRFAVIPTVAYVPGAI